MDSLQYTSDQPEFLYSVLNVPTSASQNEIRERYRALSVIFHPDKQQDDRTKDTAAKRFLEIQKAYEVLSDPFLREVYDVLGGEGLNLQWSPEVRSLPANELRDKLNGVKVEREQQKFERLINPKGRLTYGIDASSLFSRDDAFSRNNKWHEALLQRILDVRVAAFSLRHSIERRINKKTTVNVSARMSRGATTGLLGSNISGTVRHQFSPRVAFEGTWALLSPRVLNIKSTYGDRDTTFSALAHLSSGTVRGLPPPMTFSLSRRLYRNALTTGVLAFHTGPQPYLSVNVISPTPFDLTAESYEPTGPDDASQSSKLGSVSGFGVGARYWQYGATVAGVASSLKAEWGVTFAELKLQLKVGLELGILGLSWLLTGSWAPTESSEVSASVGLNAQGVIMRLELFYISQRLTIPIILSHEYDAVVALCTTVVPSTAFVVGYHFILKPRRRAQRAAYFRAARRALDEEKSNLPRETEETALLLKEVAKKHTQVESTKGGLVILEASYGPSEPDDEAKALMVDVTVPMQALVHNSQLHIPGHRTKSGLQGFYDPTPDSPKSLRIRYTFRGRTHYAEISDHVPVVLPLADHLVDQL